MSSDDEVLVRLRGIALATKRIGIRADWQTIPHKSTQALRLVAALEIDGVVIEGLYLHGRTLTFPTEQDLTFQLEYKWGGVSHQLCRLDWRPKKPHTDNAGPLASRKSFKGSQWHSFEANAQLGLFALRAGPHGNLPRAEPLDPEPPNVNVVLQEVQQRMAIVNATDVPPPPWDPQGRLL